MGKGILAVSTILDLISRIEELAQEEVICAKPGWTPDTEALVVALPEDCRIPEGVLAMGYEYFLEVDVIRQVLQEFQLRPDATARERCERVIHYARFDA